MPRQTLHPCLQIREILDHIFRNILEDEEHLSEHKKCWPAYGSSDLLSLAVTCKLFTEPALDRLWYHLADLKALGYCIPKKSFWGLESPDSYSERLDYYLNKVRVYGVDGMVAHKTHHLLIPAILRNRPENSLLFPNLKRLYIYHFDFQNLAWLPQAMIGPGIQLLHLIIYTKQSSSQPVEIQPSTWRNFDAIISKASKSLQQLTISTDQEGRYKPLLPPVSTLHSSLPTLGCLESLRVVENYLSADLLLHLTSNPRLRTLEFAISSEDAHQFLSAAPVVASNLQNVALRMRDLNLAGQVLLHLCQPSLRRLKVIQLRKDHTCWNLHQFLTSPLMAPGGAMKHLQELEVLRHDRITDPQDVVEITSDTLLPILHMPQLKVLRLSLDGRAELSPNILEKVAKACPRLRVLDLHEQTHSADQVPNLTLLDVISFAHMCKFLEELRIRVNATVDSYEVADMDKLARNGPCRTLLTFDVCLSPISNSIELITQLLFVSFPCLEHLICYNEDCGSLEAYMEIYNETHEVWREVITDLFKCKMDGLRSLVYL